MDHLRHIITDESPALPYDPFTIAKKKGLDVQSLVPSKLSQPLGVMLLNKLFPIGERGLVELDEIYAIDLAAVEFVNGKEVVIVPSCESDIAPQNRNIGKIVDQGVILLTNTRNGLARPIGHAVMGNANPWTHPGIEVGGVAIELDGIGAPFLEERKVDEESVHYQIWTP